MAGPLARLVLARWPPPPCAIGPDWTSHVPRDEGPSPSGHRRLPAQIHGMEAGVASKTANVELMTSTPCAGGGPDRTPRKWASQISHRLPLLDQADDAGLLGVGRVGVLEATCLLACPFHLLPL